MATDNNTPERKCSKCPNTYPRTEEYWYRNSNTADKLNTVCKICSRATSKKWYEEHKEYALKATSERQRRPDVVEKRKERMHERYQLPEYHDKQLQRGRDLRKRPEQKLKRLILQRKYRAKPEIKEMNRVRDKTPKYKANKKASKAKRRAIIAQAPGTFTNKDLLIQYNSQNGKCWWCGALLGDEYHADHLTPLSRGGTNAANNIVASCPTCNLSKNNKLPSEWIGRLL